MRILLVEDNIDVAYELKSALTTQFVVDLAHTGVDGTYLAQVNTYDAVLLDIGLPDINGTEICRILRGSGNTSAILMVSAKQEEGYIVSSLESGADDYVTKPFDVLELVARIRAVLRRTTVPGLKSEIEIGDIRIDTNLREVYRAGQFIPLRKKEYDLLLHLILHKGTIVSKEALLESLWEAGIDLCSNSLEVHLFSLRSRIDHGFSTHHIRTVHNLGYTFDEIGKVKRK